MKVLEYGSDVAWKDLTPSHMKNFDFVANEKPKLTNKDKKDERAFTLVTNDKLDPISQDKDGKEVKFGSEGRLFVVANLMQKAVDKAGNHTGDTVVERLRKGENITTGLQESFSITYHLDKDVDPGDGKKKIEKGTGQANIAVTARDYVKAKGTVFFGDRPTDNPGYSKFTLSDDVKIREGEVTNAQVLDAYRVEQRLTYLGFPAFGHGNTVYTVGGGKAVEFDVDGKWGDKEAHAARMFDKVIHYDIVKPAIQLAEHDKAPKKPVEPKKPKDKNPLSRKNQ